MSRLSLDLPRADRAAEAAELRAQGLTYNQIAAHMGISRSYASSLICDPDGAKDRARKASYGRPCEQCGKQTDGSNGREKAPKLCLACTDAARAAVCGTVSKYQSGCACDACREANRLVQHERRHSGAEPPSHGVSGYSNYGCRCEVCTRANTERCFGYRTRYDRNRRAAA